MSEEFGSEGYLHIPGKVLDHWGIHADFVGAMFPRRVREGASLLIIITDALERRTFTVEDQTVHLPEVDIRGKTFVWKDINTGNIIEREVPSLAKPGIRGMFEEPQLRRNGELVLGHRDFVMRVVCEASGASPGEIRSFFRASTEAMGVYDLPTIKRFPVLYGKLRCDSLNKEGVAKQAEVLQLQYFAQDTSRGKFRKGAGIASPGRLTYDEFLQVDRKLAQKKRT